MKKKIISILMLSALILSGCSGKEAVSNSTSSNTTAASSTERVEVKTNFQELKPGTAPQLSAKQKTEVNAKITSTVNDLNKILESIQDAQDIDLISVN
jgi:PBP1b-binding outer membrane lipoprotein LpoB